MTRLSVELILAGLVVAAILGWLALRVHRQWKAAQLRRRIDKVGPGDADPKALGDALLYSLLADRFGLNSDAVERCRSYVSNAERADSLAGPLLAYLCLLYRREVIVAYGTQAGDEAWEAFYAKLKALAELDDEGREIAQAVAYWIDKLEWGITVFQNDPERMEALGFSEDQCLAGAVATAHKQDEFDVPWSEGEATAASVWLEELEEVGRAFAHARAETQDRIRTQVRLLGLDEWREGFGGNN